MKTRESTIDFSGKDFPLPDAFEDKTSLLLNSQTPEELPDFTVEVANANHIYWIKEICDVTLSSAIGQCH